MLFVITVSGGYERLAGDLAGKISYHCRHARTGMHYIDILFAYYLADLFYHHDDADKGFFAYRKIIMTGADRVEFSHEPAAAGNGNGLVPPRNEIPREVYRAGLNSSDV